MKFTHCVLKTSYFHKCRSRAAYAQSTFSYNYEIEVADEIRYKITMANVKALCITLYHSMMICWDPWIGIYLKKIHRTYYTVTMASKCSVMSEIQTNLLVRKYFQRIRKINSCTHVKLHFKPHILVKMSKNQITTWVSKNMVRFVDFCRFQQWYTLSYKAFYLDCGYFVL